MSKSITHIIDIFNKKDLGILLSDCNESFSKAIPNDYWEDGVKGYSSTVKTFSLKPNSRALSIVVNKCVELFGEEPFSLLYYYWLEGGYIPWHTDENYSGAFTIYLTPDWEYQYGGLFQYNLTGPTNTILPYQNTGVYQNGGVPHSTTIQAKGSPIRKSIQCWFNRKKTKKTVI